jgi:translation initiation factor IF-1
MGKNEHGGNKQKSKKNYTPRKQSVPISQIMPDNITKFVAKVTGSVGNRLKIEVLPTNAEDFAAIPGSFRNRIWIKTNDYVLIEKSTELSGYNCFILHKYEDDELAELIELNKLKITNQDADEEEELNFVFDDGKEDDEEKARLLNRL